MGVRIQGFDDLERDLKQKYSRQAMEQAEKRAIKAGAYMMRNKVASALYKVRDTGKLAIGTDVRDPERVGNELVAYIHFRGEHLSLAHLVNNGHYDRSGKFVKPRGYQKIDTMIKLNADLYFALLKRELNK